MLRLPELLSGPAAPEPRLDHMRVHRVYCNLTLNRTRRAKRRLSARECIPLAVRGGANQVSSIDLLHEALDSGKSFRTLNVVNDHNREAVAILIDTSLSASRVTRVLERPGGERGLPSNDQTVQRTRSSSVPPSPPAPGSTAPRLSTSSWAS